mmetsp:Transcript_24913/g.40001  ORF Transcript_24913/g.40001 Transcript_24913/m.40001 type:complete len:83 (+) Transcript_24913:275-523(+)
MLCLPLIADIGEGSVANKIAASDFVDCSLMLWCSLVSPSSERVEIFACLRFSLCGRPLPSLRQDKQRRMMQIFRILKLDSQI